MATYVSNDRQFMCYAKCAANLCTLTTLVLNCVVLSHKFHFVWHHLHCLKRLLNYEFVQSPCDCMDIDWHPSLHFSMCIDWSLPTAVHVVRWHFPTALHSCDFSRPTASSHASTLRDFYLSELYQAVHIHLLCRACNQSCFVCSLRATSRLTSLVISCLSSSYDVLRLPYYICYNITDLMQCRRTGIDKYIYICSRVGNPRLFLCPNRRWLYPFSL